MKCSWERLPNEAGFLLIRPSRLRQFTPLHPCLNLLMQNVTTNQKMAMTKITGDSDKLIVQLYSISPNRNHCFSIEKKRINPFKMVYFLLGRYRTNQLISLSEFPVIYGNDYVV
jgi:hypothetical protein